MKIYKVTRRRSFNEHAGYSYYSNKRKAEQEQRKENDGGNDNDEVQEYDFTLTKKGILELLEQVATHPDNG